MKDEALQMCLEYIETDAHERKYVRHAIKQALAAPVQETLAKDNSNYRLDPPGLDPLYTTPPAQPAVPDALGTREGEHPQYIQGWNDCRAEMLKGGNT
jgi:hypothetical protein